MDDDKSWVSKHQNLGTFHYPCTKEHLFFAFYVLQNLSYLLFVSTFFCFYKLTFIVGRTPGLYAIVVKGKLQKGNDAYYDPDDQTDY